MNPFRSLNKITFMPDATYGTVNSLSYSDLSRVGTEFLVTNTLHMYLNFVFENDLPFKKLTNFNGGVLTDSGGFQAYSFVKKGLGKVTEEYIDFLSPKDKSKHRLTPEKSIDIQLKLRSDAIVVLDDPIDPDESESRILSSVERTIRWAKQCKLHFENELSKIQLSGENYDPLIFCVIQGGGNFALREKCFIELYQIGFDGYGFGGWPLKDGVFFDDLIKFNADLVNSIKDKKVFNYAMGVGTPDDIVKCMGWGYDLFDCVLPTRNARHGLLYTAKGMGEKGGEHFDVLRITSARYKDDTTVVSSESNVEDVSSTTKMYLRYMFKQKETTAFRISTLNNLEFYNKTINKFSQIK